MVGHATTVSPGEWINASGEWANERTHGQQFRVLVAGIICGNLGGLPRFSLLSNLSLRHGSQALCVAPAVGGFDQMVAKFASLSAQRREFSAEPPPFTGLHALLRVLLAPGHHEIDQAGEFACGCGDRHAGVHSGPSRQVPARLAAIISTLDRTRVFRNAASRSGSRSPARVARRIRCPVLSEMSVITESDRTFIWHADIGTTAAVAALFCPRQFEPKNNNAAG